MRVTRIVVSIAVALLGIPTAASAAIRGSVLDDAGAPVAGAEVTAFKLEGTDARLARFASDKPERPPLATVKTDSKGAFSIGDVKQPVVCLTITAPGHAQRGLTTTANDDVGTILQPRAVARSGRVTAEGKPVAGARVFVLGEEESESLLTTDADGRYSIPDPAVSRNQRMIVAPGFAHRYASEKEIDVPLDRGATLAGTVVKADGTTPVAGAKLTLDGWPAGTSGADGSFTIEHAPQIWRELRAETATEAAIASPKAGRKIVIRLAPAATLTGTVIDATTRRPIPNVHVALGTAFGTTSYGSLTTVADEKGAFRFAGLITASYRLTGTSPDFIVDFTSLTVKAGENVTKMLYARPVARITGRVVDDTRSPLPGFQIHFTRFHQPLGAISGLDGGFVLRGLRPDTDLELIAEKAGSPQGQGSRLRLKPGERREGITFVIQRGVKLAGIVRGPDKQPLAGASIWVFPAGAQEWDLNNNLFMAGPSAAVKSGADGRFETRVAEGKVDAAARAEGFALATLRSADAGRSAKPLEIQLNKAVEITGKVLHADGTPVAGASVGFMNSAAQRMPPPTLDDGSFRVDDLNPGKVDLVINKSDENIRETRTVTAPAKDLLIQLPPGGKISGRVTDAATSRPVTAFTTSLLIQRAMAMGGMVQRTGTAIETIRDDDGRYTIENVKAGTVDVLVGAPGYATRRTPGIAVEEGKTVTVDVALQKGVRLTGRVTGPDAAPMADVNVIDSPQTEVGNFMARLQGQTDSNGEYAIENLEPGDRTFDVFKAGYPRVRKSVHLEDQETRLDIQLTAGVSIQGSVVGADGAPIPGASVMASSPAGGGSSGHTTSDSAGSFTIEGINPGHYRLVAQKRGLVTANLTDVAVEQNVAGVILKMDSGGAVSGHVRGLSPDDLTRVAVRSPGNFSGTTVDASGSYRIEGLAAGSTSVQAYLRDSSGASRVSERKTVDVTSGGEAVADLEFAAGFTIRGRLTKGGAPLPNAHVRYYSMDSSASFAEAISEAAGIYEVTGLRSAKYRIVVGLSTGSTFVTTYEVTATATNDIDVTGPALRGVVTDADSGAAIVEASINAAPSGHPGQPSATLTDSNGGFVIDPLSAGSYRLRITKTSYAPKLMDVTVSEAASIPLEVKLTKSDGITLRVVDARDGRTIAASIIIRNTADHVLTTQSAQSADGSYRVALEAGTYRAIVTATGCAPADLVVTSPSPEMSVALGQGGHVTIRAGARSRIRIMGDHGVYHPWPMQEMDWLPVSGTMSLDHFAAGSYTIQVLDARGAVTRTLPLTVREGGEAVVDL